MINKIVEIRSTLVGKITEAHVEDETTITISVDEAVKILDLTHELEAAAHDYDVHHSNKNDEFNFWGF